MSETDELRRRVETLEARVDAVHDRMTQTHAMVAINDRDMADLKLEMRAHRKVLEALRETQLEQSERIDALDTKMTNGFATVLAAVQALAERLPEEPAS
ncbi:hypothetical protein [Streptomyces phytophilus]|uniref:hypothetical protein n=1 Tax=Streptomyces phytophilus TaxID=722715 RepID=UPI0015EFF8C0|nr:hypothetical protein [Streptomyces phytophilus]